MPSDLKDRISQSGILTPDELETYSQLASRGTESLWEILLRENRLTESSLADLFAQWLKIPLVSLSAQPVDPEVAHRIPEKLARRYQCIPIAVDTRCLRVAMVDPTNFEAIQAIEFFTGLSVAPVVAPRSEVLQAVEEHFSRSQVVDFLAETVDSPEFQVISTGEQLDLDENASLRASEIPPIIKLASLVITEAISIHASDIHVEPSQRDIRIRLRVDGVLRDFLQAPAWLAPGLTSRLKVLGKLDIAEKRRPQDGRFKVKFRDRMVDFRISTLPTQFGEKSVLRLLGSGESIPDVKDLGLSTSAVDTLIEAVMQPQGMIIVTGPTGSGKTTALYSLLCRRRSSEVSIVTVEDPIEYQLEGANQVQVNPRAGLNFASCLRSILRQDPDVILVGEIRDRETAEIAFHAAMTGHLVLTTLHTNNSIATILRLLDLGVDPFVLSSTVTLIMAQRLARRVCDPCREAYSPSFQVLDKLGWDDSAFTFTRGKGCKACHTTGFKGRIGIFEILKMTAAIRSVINRKGAEDDMRRAALASGFAPLVDDARKKILDGISTPEEVVRVIQSDDKPETRCERCGQPLDPKLGRCTSCSNPPRLYCTHCGEAIDWNWKVCPRCGARPFREPARGDLHGDLGGEGGLTDTGKGPRKGEPEIVQ